MCKKLVCLISLFLLVGLVSNSWAWPNWDTDTGDDRWRTADNWDNNTVPTGAIDIQINVNEDVNSAIIDAGPTLQVRTLRVGYTNYGTLTIETGGTLETNRYFLVSADNGGNGTLIMNGGSLLLDAFGLETEHDGRLIVGQRVIAQEGYQGTLYMNSGIIDAPQWFQIAQDAGSVGRVHLDGGTITTGELRINRYEGADGHMDVNDGVLKISGNVEDTVNGYISSGYITAFNNSPRAKLIVSYDGTYTWLRAIPRDASIAWNPKPTGTAVERSPILSWSPGDYAPGTNGHYVYFGKTTDPCLVTTPSQPQTPNNYTPGDLELGQQYFWRIDEVNTSGAGVDEGTLWSFTVAEYIIVDDMESYNSGINDIWQDGNEVVKTSGSVIYLETGTVHEGSRAMKYTYNNSGSTAAPYYSEIEANTVGPNSLPVGLDWTAGGVEALYLYFYGQANNDANSTEQMYVALKDSSTTAVVPYTGNANDVQNEEWMVWRIDLDDFSGVILNDVQKVYIGFGDRYTPALVGGTGTVYFDDARLYKSRCLKWNPDLGGEGFPDIDFNEDCVVDFEDIYEVTDDWLNTGMWP